MDEDDLYNVRFFDLVELGGLPPQGTLEGASGFKSDPGPYATGLIERVETAWRTPYRDLTCAQVSTLVEQKMGLQWLGAPALEFASRYPLATIQYYPGEMGVSCFRAAAELMKVAQAEFRIWMSGDFGWIEEAFGWSPSFLKEVKAELAKAREMLHAQ